jgi:hypothetical protein
LCIVTVIWRTGFHKTHVGEPLRLPIFSWSARRAFLARTPRVFATAAGARRLADRSDGLAPWQSRELTEPD